MYFRRISRRDFAKAMTGFGIGMGSSSKRILANEANSKSVVASNRSLPGSGNSSPPQGTRKLMRPSRNLIWGQLVHLSFNMWLDREAPEYPYEYAAAKPYLRFDLELWNELVEKMVQAGLNMVVLDLGDGVKYESHPEIAVKGAWSVSQLREEVIRLRKMGLEPIPKLNFSAGHDAWLGPYSRCVSTDKYYQVCRDLIHEVGHIFDRPRFFHLGMDEEALEAQLHYEYVVIRQFDLWWHDLYFLAETVDKVGSRPWVWSDYRWHKPEVFFKRMPKSILQSNWYYGDRFSEDVASVKAYLDLEAHGFDQIPTASNWPSSSNFSNTVSFAMEHISPERLYGFLQTTWKPTLLERRYRHLEAIDLVGQVIARLRDRTK